MISAAARRIWDWLPARADSRRVTLPGTIAAALSMKQADVAAALAELARGNHITRDSTTGTAAGWHRSKPLPTPAPEPPDEPEWSLFDQT